MTDRTHKLRAVHTDGTAPDSPDIANPVDEAIGTEARVNRKSIILPTALVPREKWDEVRDAVKAHIRQYAISQKEVGLCVGRAPSVISQVLSGTYDKGDSEGVLRALNTWIDNDELRRQRGKPVGFYATAVFDAIRALARFAKSNAPDTSQLLRGDIYADQPHIALGYGPAGCGKSVGAKALAAEDTTAILIRCDQRTTSAIGLARLMCEVMGLRERKSMLDWVISELKGSGRLLIVDEAHRLRTSACEFLRDLHDVAGIPILLLGTHLAAGRLTGVRHNTQHMLYDQFSSRVGYVVDLVRGIDGRGGLKRPIYSLAEIQAIFKRDNVRVTPDAYEFLRDCACVCGLGMLRLCASIFDKAARSIERKGGMVDAALLRKSAGRSLLPAGEVDIGIMSRIDLAAKTHNAMAAAG